ncbi:hypothetical protein DFQ28_001870 [Apophysomyces sp. BC1034]|nr:hypothetical protein DFQ30_002298 [Apophysomyces sp. BC1015]KAG0180063.1 hypothetical protein DFQ29_001284 [Apophysomyces sp. BC1021]KAG0190577.1 hypothetical protein DFQ28_001870 [Apophysomyces sp. BC1034]
MSKTKIEKFEAFSKYDFGTDERFMAGVASLQANADMLNRAKWYYYTKFVEAFDYEEYQNWKENAKPPTDSINEGPKDVESSEDLERPKRFTFEQIVQMIETGQEIPGIKQIPNKLNESAPSKPALTIRPKPWETK